MNHVEFLQWPAMVASVIAAWLVASQNERRRQHGFWWFISSNVLWVIWAWNDGAWALVSLQVALAAMNIRGLHKNDPETPKSGRTASHGT